MPWPVHPNGLLGAQGDNDTYQISRSLRFNSADSAYLNRTPASAGNRKTWTWSGWVKRGTLGGNNVFMGNTDSSGYNGLYFQFDTNNNITIGDYGFGSYVWVLTTSQVFRDTSAWYHIVATFDSTQATTSDRVSLYVNGVKTTAFTTASYPSLNLDGRINSTQLTSIGRLGSYNGFYFDGYLTEINFIDGQALTPSSFGETDAITGRWKAKAYSGTYGTNGFYLKFADNSGTTATTLGKDSSPNGNNWTPNNFSVTAGVGNDSLVDSPTNYGGDSYNTTVDNSRGNYNTFNPLSKVTTATLTNGNIDAGASGIAIGSIGMSSGKWYWEITSTGGATAVGMYGASATSTRSVAAGTTEGFRFDSVAGTLDYTTNGSTFTNIATGLTSTPYFIYVSTAAATTASLNCGQRLFSYTMPSGYKTLCTTNLPTPTIKKPSSYMDVVTYTGTGSALTPTSSLGFSPDLVWLKSRSAATDHALYDTVRGAEKRLESNTTDAEVTSDSGVTAFNSNGFTLGTLSQANTNTATYVAWAWDEAPIAGMDIVSYTGTGAIRTVAHNLGVAPKMIIAKLTNSAGFQWPVYHSSLTSASSYIWLNSTNAQATDATYWGTAPTSSVFSVGTNANVNNNTSPYIAYCFAEVEGFSKFGSYTGTGTTDGAFVWCGFRPRYVLVKRTDASATWIVKDTARDTYNQVVKNLYPNQSNAEDSFATVELDILSNSFKLRGTATDQNASGGTYIFAAFAESPFKYARAR